MGAMYDSRVSNLTSATIVILIHRNTSLCSLTHHSPSLCNYQRTVKPTISHHSVITSRNSTKPHPCVITPGNPTLRRGGLAGSNSTVVVSTTESAADVVRRFYEGINGRDLASVEDLISQNCVYEDLVFSQPFVGRKAILDFFNKFMDSISKDLQFVIDDMSEEDNTAVGVTWHLEWKGKPFPFSKGCSFYRLDVAEGLRQIVYGRDIVEPAIKPGESALAVIRGVTWLLQNFSFLAERL